MEKSLFEQMGGTYTQDGDYLIPSHLANNKATDRSMGTATRKIFETTPQNYLYEPFDKWETK